MQSILSAVTLALFTVLSLNATASTAQPDGPVYTVSVHENDAVEHRYTLAFAGEGAERVYLKGTVMGVVDRLPGDADITGASIAEARAGLTIRATPLATTPTGEIVTRLRFESTRFGAPSGFTLGDGTLVRTPNIDVIARLERTVVVAPGGTPVIVGRGNDGSVISIAAAR